MRSLRIAISPTVNIRFDLRRSWLDYKAILRFFMTLRKLLTFFLYLTYSATYPKKSARLG